MRLALAALTLAVCVAIPSEKIASAQLRSASHAQPVAVTDGLKYEPTLVTVGNIQISVDNKNATGNSTHNRHLTPFPLRISAGDIDLVNMGFCFEGCRYGRAIQLEKAEFSWASQLSKPASYVLTVTPMNANIANSVGVVVGGAVGDEQVIQAETGKVPTDAVINDNAVGAEFSTIRLNPTCRATGLVILHIRIADPAHNYAPIHLFAKHVCYVEEQEACEGLVCGSHGVCHEGKCECMENYFGEFCGSSVFDPCPAKCSGNALGCSKIANSFSCQCLPGYSGASCNQYTGCSHLSLCSGHGQCIDNEACGCDAGWSGAVCDRPSSGADACSALSHCKGHGLCEMKGSSYECVCDEGYEGPTCGTVKATCPNSCSGHGVCEGSSCRCNFGFSGDDCSSAFSPCGGCMHGTCSESIDDVRPRCVCKAGFTGPHCAVYDHSTDPCRNHSFCSAHGRCAAGDSCDCNAGYSGEDCNVVAVEGCVGACGGHGRCDPSTDTCKCSPGWSGADCSVSRCPSVDGLVCSGHGLCKDQGPPDNAMACVCLSGFFGPSCHNAYCTNSTCSGHGTCKKSSGVWDSLCQCDAGYTGPICATPSAAVSLFGKVRHAPAKVLPENHEDSMDDFLDTAP